MLDNACLETLKGST